MTTTLANAMAAGPIVLDGGLGTLLAAHGHDLSSSLWSAQLLLDNPAAIRRAQPSTSAPARASRSAPPTR